VPPLSFQGMGLSRFLMYVPNLTCATAKSAGRESDKSSGVCKEGLRGRDTGQRERRDHSRGDVLRGELGWVTHLLRVVVLVRKVQHCDKNGVRPDKGDEGVRDLLPLRRLSCQASETGEIQVSAHAGRK
jgi:hypothetical protein